MRYLCSWDPASIFRSVNIFAKRYIYLIACFGCSLWTVLNLILKRSCVRYFPYWLVFYFLKLWISYLWSRFVKSITKATL